MKGLVVLRRDLRLVDNTALNAALKDCEEVAVCFIFDPRQLDHAYFSEHAFSFLVKSLQEVREELRKKGSDLNVFQGEAEQVVTKLKPEFDALYVNRDYTPFSQERDEKLAKVFGEQFHSFADCLVHEPEEAMKKDGTPFRVFTPFYKNALTLPMRTPKPLSKGKFIVAKGSKPELLDKMYKEFPNLRVKGGRTEALQLLKEAKSIGKYSEDRNIPSVHGTSLLSAHHKFGTISIRESWEGLVFEPELQRQLIWRDFFHHIAFHFPHVFKGAYDQRYNNIKWKNNKKQFEQWCKGETGFPIVDAGMRELNATGYMHNRTRMVVASFLVKDLHIDWRWGERYFATKLVDYDPCVNNGSWQWAAGTGCDAAPYFRVFNPWRQQERFDKDCLYIREWVPELAEYTPKQIHKLETQTILGCAYPSPMVAHREVAEETKRMFKAAQSTSI